MKADSVSNHQLTDLQRRILKFFAEYVEQHHGRSPTQRDIVKGAGVSSTSVVKYNLAILEARGWLAHEQGISRGYTLLRRPE